MPLNHPGDRAQSEPWSTTIRTFGRKKLLTPITPAILTASSRMSEKSDFPIAPGRCACGKDTSFGGPQGSGSHRSDLG